jgi:hypothetical protein
LSQREDERKSVSFRVAFLPAGRWQKYLLTFAPFLWYNHIAFCTAKHKNHAKSNLGNPEQNELFYTAGEVRFLSVKTVAKPYAP